ncbi:GntR family transcriptional regulator [Herbidospora daliensis]|uniref:GntR family transcriptional regulator n=1 Tax=Herbidospora daliensis TaxID=295585 RepID=UPI000783AE23|nr:GntR family transcriptional regulator [Herbidospora daliensis]
MNESTVLVGWRVFPQIAAKLRERIASGQYAAGVALPSEGELCREFRVARNTVRRAFAELEREGLLVTVPSRGRFVASGGSLSEPYHYQFIARDLRERISNGDLRPGAPIPSESELRERFGASRNTVRQALIVLEREGLIVVKHGKGRFVRGADQDG